MPQHTSLLPPGLPCNYCYGSLLRGVIAEVSAREKCNNRASMLRSGHSHQQGGAEQLTAQVTAGQITSSKGQPGQAHIRTS